MNKKKISIIGVGYVGLPLAMALSKKNTVIGYDINKSRIKSLNKNIDEFNEYSKKDLLNKDKTLKFSFNEKDINKSNTFIITVPTPVNINNKPDLSLLKNATKLVAKYLTNNSVVVFELTVFPGCTEEICVPILERISRLKLNKDFYCGYSPERINVGDKKHKISNVTKIVSGSNIKTLNYLHDLYGDLVTKKIYKAPSIKVAEAAKVIENTQRDINIALVNEFSLIFDKMNIDTKEVLDAAATKWNFIRFEPGLVGGHCVGVDPYYLAHQSQKYLYKPQIILAGRKINKSMAGEVARGLIKNMNKNKINVKKSKILIMGYAFKENCSDFRNSKVENIYNILSQKKLSVKIYDPLIKKKFLNVKIQKDFITKLSNNTIFDAIIFAVPHKKFLEIGIIKIKKFLKKNGVFYDIKSIFPKHLTDKRL